MARTKIKTADITADAVTSAEIATGAVGTTEIATDAVTATEIAADTITNTQIKSDAAIATSKITGLATSATTDTTDADNITSGTMGTARLGSGTADATTFLRGDQTYAAVDTSGIVANQDDIALLGFKVAANGSLARYNLVDQSIDAFEDASGVDASASSDAVRNASKYYSGLAATQTAFTSTGNTTWTSPAGLTSITVLVVAGGGGCGKGGWPNGGGGAGGLVYVADYTVTASTLYNLTIGAGGAAVTSYVVGNNGADSVFDTSGTSQILTAVGGGYAGHYNGTAAVGNGGSGGGGSVAGTTGTSTQPASFGSYSNVGFGNAGGAGNSGDGPGGRPTGGGGGAGSAGNAYNGSPAGQGGAGKDYSSVFGTGVGDSGWFASGGGAGNPGGTAQSGGGGDGGGSGNAGAANTGGGAGGSTNDQNGSAGGSGVIIVKYDQPADLTLVSNAQTAESAPTNGDLVITISNGAGTTTPNTDIKAYISRDGSAYSSAVTLVDQGDTGGHTILTANGVDLSGITSGTSMRWKVTTHNQSASKTTRIQAVSLGWS